MLADYAYIRPCFSVQFSIKCNYYNPLPVNSNEWECRRSYPFISYRSLSALLINIAIIFSRLMWIGVSALLLLLHVQLMDDPEGLEELVEVDAAILVEIDAACHVVNGSVVHIHTQVRTEQVPCLAELLDGNLTCEKRGLKPINNTRQIPSLL